MDTAPSTACPGIRARRFHRPAALPGARRHALGPRGARRSAIRDVPRHGHALEEFRADTVGQSKRIADVRSLLEQADDAGEAYVETEDPAEGETFAAISSEIDRGLVDLEMSGSRSERLLASSARLRWARARATIDRAILLPPTGGDGAS